MRKTAMILCGGALAAAPGLWAQTAPPAPPDAQYRTQLDGLEKQMIELHTMPAAMAGPNTFTFVGGQLFNGSPVKGQPYSAEAVNESTQVLADGNKIVHRSSTMMYRDSEGRERREEAIGKIGEWTSGGDPAKVVFISDPVSKMSYTLHSENRTAEKIAAPVAGAMMLRTNTLSAQAPVGTAVRDDIALSYKIEADTVATHAAQPHAAAGGRGGVITAGTLTAARAEPRTAGPAPKIEDLGTQTIEGVPAQGTRTTQIIPAGQIGNERDINIVSERWFSKDLGMVVMTKRSDPRSGETVYKLTNVSRSEPQRYLFEIPGDYTVSEPQNRMVRKVMTKDDQE